MTTSRQKRIEELEKQVKAFQAKAERLQMSNYQLTHYLQEIAKDRAMSPQEYAKWALEDTGFTALLQQRDLNIAYLTVAKLKFPTMLRKMWSGGEVQQWIDQYAEVLKARATAHQEDKIGSKETLQ